MTLDVVLEGWSCQSRGLLRKESRVFFFPPLSSSLVSAHADMVVEWLTCGHTLSDRHQAPAHDDSGGDGGWGEGFEGQRYKELDQKKRHEGKNGQCSDIWV